MSVFVLPVPAEASTRSDSLDVLDRRRPGGVVGERLHGISSSAKSGASGRADRSASRLAS